MTTRPPGFGDTRTVQLEAFAPDELLDLLRGEIESRRDLDVYQAVLDEEQNMRQELMERLA